MTAVVPLAAPHRATRLPPLFLGDGLKIAGIASLALPQFEAEDRQSNRPEYDEAKNHRDDLEHRPATPATTAAPWSARPIARTNIRRRARTANRTLYRA